MPVAPSSTTFVLAGPDPALELVDRRRLVAGGLEVADDLEGGDAALEVGGGSHADQPYVGPPTVSSARPLRSGGAGRAQSRVDLGLQAGEVAVVVDHDVGRGTPLFPGRLRGDPGPGVGLGHPAVGQPLAAGSRRRRRPRPRRRSRCRPFSTSSGMSWTTTASAGAAAVSSALRAPDERMDDRVRGPRAARGRRTRPLPAAAGPASRRRPAPPGRTRSTTAASPGVPGRDDLAGEHVGVDDHSAVRRQQLGDRGLARPDAARQPHRDHRVDVHPRRPLEPAGRSQSPARRRRRRRSAVGSGRRASRRRPQPASAERLSHIAPRPRGGTRSPRAARAESAAPRASPSGTAERQASASTSSAGASVDSRGRPRRQARRSTSSDAAPGSTRTILRARTSSGAPRSGRQRAAAT